MYIDWYLSEGFGGLDWEQETFRGYHSGFILLTSRLSRDFYLLIKTTIIPALGQAQVWPRSLARTALKVPASHHISIARLAHSQPSSE